MSFDTMGINNQEKENASNHDIRNIVMDKLRVIPGIGCVMALLSGFFFATAGFTVEMAEGADPAFIITVRTVLQLFIFLPFVIYFKEPIHGVDGERLSLLGRSILGYISFLVGYYSLSYISFTDSQAILFSAPVFTAMFACVLLKEPFGIFNVVTSIITIIGVFLIARPTFLFPPESIVDVFSPEDRIIGLIFAVVGLFTISYVYICMRQLQKTPTNAVIVYFSIFCIFAGSLTMNINVFVTGKPIVLPPSFFSWMMILVNGICCSLAQVTLVISLKLEEAGLVCLLRTIDVVVAFFYQAVFLNQPIHWTTIVGSVIVCSGCIAVGLKKILDSKKKARDASQSVCLPNDVISYNISSNDEKQPV